MARACIALGCHYVNLADARAFVAGIDALDADARSGNVLVVSGASSVPCLTSAVCAFENSMSSSSFAPPSQGGLR